MDRRPSTVTSARIRNFCIIAHIDHGKSTLADRFLEITGTVRKEALEAQTLDSMDLEKERGITIKAKAVMMKYKADDGQLYTLNLIDTPGHVDFSYEVSKALQACEGALLLVDAAQGIEAQTVANYHLAERAKLRIIPVINKIDLPTARPELIEEEFENILMLERERVLRASAKTGIGVKEILETVVRDVPPPTGDPDAPMRALVFDSVFDDYRGVIVHVRVFDGSFGRGDKIRMKGVGSTHEVLEVGTFIPGSMIPRDRLRVGETGYMIANIKTLSDVRIGDTVCLEKEASTVVALPGYKAPQHMVFCGIYPTQNKDFDQLRRALEKLSLNDASFSYTPESSDALGFGFRCGFLGLLHMEIVQERLERESNVDIVQTAPNVTYEVVTTSGDVLRIESPARAARSVADRGVPRAGHEARHHRARPSSSAVMLGLAIERRGQYLQTDYIGETRVMLVVRDPARGDHLRLLRQAEVARRAATARWTTKSSASEARAPRSLRILVSGRRSRRAVDDRAIATSAESGGRKMLVKLREGDPAPPCSKSRCRPRSAARSSRARASRDVARTSPRSATAATSRASASCSRSRRKARSA
jgi:GTP-binding protein LepA